MEKSVLQQKNIDLCFLQDSLKTINAQGFQTIERILTASFESQISKSVTEASLQTV